MGSRGPVPSRDDDLARDRSRKGGDQTPVTKGTGKTPHLWFPDPEWTPLAVDLFNSATTSGQTDFYQDTDWAMLKMLCSEITAYERSQAPWETDDGRTIYPKRNGQWLSAIMSLASTLLLTEGDRRRVRIELSTPDPVQRDFRVVAMESYGDVANPK